MDFSIGDAIAKYAPLIGWSALVTIVWRISAKYRDQTNTWQEIDKQSKIAAEATLLVSRKVDVLQDNHMKRLQEGLDRLSDSNDRAVVVLQDISSGIKVLVDRGQRETIVETKIRHVTPVVPGDEVKE